MSPREARNIAAIFGGAKARYAGLRKDALKRNDFDQAFRIAQWQAWLDEEESEYSENGIILVDDNGVAHIK